MIWDAALVLLWFAGLAVGLKLWVYWLRPARSWYYSPEEAPSVTVRVAAAVVASVLIGLAGIPIKALALALGALTAIVIMIMAVVTLVAYRNKRGRGWPRSRAG
jgi:hypothetical protein